MNVLTIAGTDPSGGAGIQADLQVFRDHGVHGLSVITAIVWQNTSKVIGWRSVSPEDLRAQLTAVFDDIDVAAIKIGMLGSAANMLVVGEVLKAARVPIVLDPVMTSGDGGTALIDSAPDTLLALCRTLGDDLRLITPNVPEAVALSTTDTNNLHPDGLEHLAEALRHQIGRPVLLKTGHADGTGELRDILVDDRARWLKPLPRIPDDVRGTGCQLSSAIACRLAAGDDLLTAVETSRTYLSDRLKCRLRIGKGRAVVVRNND